VPTTVAFLAALFLAAAPAPAQAPDLQSLERAAAERPADVDSQRKLAAAYDAAGRRIDAVNAWRKVTELAPNVPAAWYALGHAYNAIGQDAIRSFDQSAADAPWRQLLVADGLLATGHLTDAFAIYRAVQEQLPGMVAIHDSIARIYERSGHADWAARERTRGVLSAACAKRTAFCEFRAGRARAALDATTGATDAESRYWRARAATELAVASFKHLETLPDSPERRAARATTARAEDRHQDAIVELNAALALAPGNPVLTYELASAYYAARNFDQAVMTLAPMLRVRPDDTRVLKLSGYALLQLRRLDEAQPMLERASAADPADPGPRLALGRLRVQRGDFAAAIPLIEPHLAGDQDGSLHVQLARAYTAIGQREKAAALLTRSQDLQRAAELRSAAAARRTIDAPR
jgi:tetratricopeptide (TPR) repeat protein